MSLLAFLACSPIWLSRAKAAEWIRPEIAPSKALAYLRRTLHRLRESFPGLPVEVDGDRIRWAGSSDVSEFEQAIGERNWQRAIELQTEPLLADVRFDEEQPTDAWFLAERQRLNTKLAGALMALVQHLQEGADADCADLFDRLVRTDPLNEMNVRFVLRRARTTLERIKAIEAFETLDRKLRTEQGIRPDADTRGLAAKARLTTSIAWESSTGMGGRVDLPATEMRSPDHDADVRPGPGGIAMPAVPLGREDDMKRALDLLCSGCSQLVTISGPGGVGKSHLARAISQNLEASRQAVVHWVDLHACHGADELVASLAAQFDLPGGAGPAEHRLAQWLAQRSGVAILDNFEQLVSHSSLLARLLRGAPGMRFVVTSRERLGLQEEALVPLNGLDFAAPDSAASKLFMRHAARLGHAIPADQHEDVVRLVRYVEGLPLAIELAAHWVPLLDVKQIVEELERDARFADGAAPSHSGRTIRSVFESTWARLETDERKAMIALATVSAPMTLATARAVVDTQDASVFHRLVSKSLLSRTASGRMKLHPLIGEFALQQGDEAEIRNARLRHAEHFLGRLAEEPLPRYGQHAPARIREMQEHSEDLAAAFRFAADSGMLDLIASATPALGFCFARSSQWETGALLVQDVLSRFGPAEPKLSLLRSFGCCAILKTGRLAEAAEAATQAIADIRRGAPRSWLALCLSWVGKARGDYELSLKELTYALEVLDDEDVYVEIVVRQEIGSTLMLRGQLQPALEQLSKALSMARQHQAPLYEARVLTELGALLSLQGDASRASALLHEGLRLGELAEDESQVATAERQLSYVHMQLGEFADQLRCATSSLERIRRAGFYYELGEAEFAVALALIQQGRAQEGEQSARRAIAICRQLDTMPALLRGIFLLGYCKLASDRMMGLSLMYFAMMHPARRRTDIVFARQLWSWAHATPGERRQAREMSRTLSVAALPVGFETIGGVERSPD